MFEANSLCDKLLFVANVVTDNIRNKCAPLRAASPHHTQYIFLKWQKESESDFPQNASFNGFTHWQLGQ